MKALVYTGPLGSEFRDTADPAPCEGEVLIRVEAVGICGSDMHAWHGHDDRRPPPLILGHEAAGVIVGGPRDGERVTVNPLVTCGTCRYCRQRRENLCPERQIISMPPREGAFAQFLAMPERNLVTVPDHVPFTHAALVEPVAVSWHSVRLGLEALHGAPQGPVLVLGGGAIGLAAALALKAQGISDIVLAEPNDARRAYLEDVAPATLVPRAEGAFDLIVDAVGIDPTRAAASALANPGGVIVHIGLGGFEGGLDIRRITLQEITFIGTYTYTDQDFRDTAQAMFEGRLGDMGWTDIRPLADGAAAFVDLHEARVAAPKVVLLPWG